MIVPTTVDKGVRPHLATVAEDEKIWFPMTVFAKSRHQDQIRYRDSENHRPDEQRKSGGAILMGVAMTSSKCLKCLNQHKNWHGYHFLGWRFQISMLRRLSAKGRGTFEWVVTITQHFKRPVSQEAIISD